jgi:sensor c-di-GMP phosphodiesterase-like protein
MLLVYSVDLGESTGRVWMQALEVVNKGRKMVAEYISEVKKKTEKCITQGKEMINNMVGKDEKKEDDKQRDEKMRLVLEMLRERVAELKRMKDEEEKTGGGVDNQKEDDEIEEVEEEKKKTDVL